MSQAIAVTQDVAVHATKHSLEGGPKACRPSQVVVLEYWQLMAPGVPKENG